MEQLFFQSQIVQVVSGLRSALALKVTANSPIVTSAIFDSRITQQVLASSRLAAGVTP